MSATKEEYMREVGAAVEAASAVPGEVAATPALPDIVPAIAFREKLPEMPAAVIDGILLEGHKMLVTGASKAYKTWLLLNLAISVATGGIWVDFACAKRKVLFIDLETDVRTLQRRIVTLADAKGASAAEVSENLSVWPLRGKMCTLAQIVDELIARCKPGDFGMVIIDPAYMIQDGDENNARDIREFFAVLDRLCVHMGCTVVMSHHHSKGAQGHKSSIDRGSGSGVFGRAPDAVVDMTQLVVEAGTYQMAREVNSLADAEDLTGWRMSFTLREFPRKPPLDLWQIFPLHVPDATGLLADCKPDLGGLSEQRRARLDAESSAKVADLDAACERLMRDSDFILREDLATELKCSRPTVRDRLKLSKRFMSGTPEPGGKAIVVRRPDCDDE